MPVIVFGAMTSVYTDLHQNCKRTTQANEGEGGQTLECAGVGGFKLLHATDDDRDNLLLEQGQMTEDLALWSRISGSFQHLGEKAEWRLKDGRPVALIVRMYLSDP